MAYLLLTGGTGLLGNYLVRDLLTAGTDLALMVRSTRKETAHARVEDLLARWEQEEEREFPRPVVLEGNLTQENLGLDASSLTWIERHCDAVIHNAASLAFQAAGPNNEPWLSNLNGTRHVLELCKKTGIRKFHHVSTAYVSGARTGRILEAELDEGQTHGNDYEVSKFRAELMVRDATFLDRPTIYRPGIILGDSKTGYTSTYFGFYAPLKLMSAMLSKAAGVASTKEELIAHVRFASQRLTEILNLSEEERKNYVPVDWVSAVTAHIVGRPELHGKTYHLTPREPVRMRLTRDVIEGAFVKYTELAEEKTHGESDWSEFEQYFTEGMKVYRSYWCDDPVFDTTNTSAAAPHLPCPTMDADFFKRICRFAFESNFGRRADQRLAHPSFDVREKMLHWTSVAPANKDANGHRLNYVGLRVDGAGGGQWEMVVADDRLIAVEPGVSDRCMATFCLNSHTFASLASESTSALEALESGNIDIQGNGVPLKTLVRALDEIAAGIPGACRQ